MPSKHYLKIFEPFFFTGQKFGLQSEVVTENATLYSMRSLIKNLCGKHP